MVGDGPYGNERREARDRNRRRRGERAGRSDRQVTTCPECRTHYPTLRGFDGGDSPETCNECGARLSCGNCGSDLSTVDRSEGSPLAAGECPRCQKPADGSDSGPGSEEWTWDG